MSSNGGHPPWRTLVRALSIIAALSGCRDSNLRLPTPPPDLATSARVTRGRAIFLEHCALCHGERADGRGPRREGLDRLPRDFTSTEWRASATAPGVFVTLRDGVDGSPMPSWSALGDEALWDLTGYVLSVAAPGRTLP